MCSASLHAWQKPESVYGVQSPESLEEMHMGRDIRQMPMASSRSMPNEFFLDQACCRPQATFCDAALPLQLQHKGSA